MADENTATAKPNVAQPAPSAPANDRKSVIAAYLDAATRDAKAALVAKHPWLSEIFSAINHS